MTGPVLGSEFLERPSNSGVSPQAGTALGVLRIEPRFACLDPSGLIANASAPAALRAPLANAAIPCATVPRRKPGQWRRLRPHAERSASEHRTGDCAGDSEPLTRL